MSSKQPLDRLTPEQARADSDYRRGVHQTIATVGRWLAGCPDLAEARALIGRAESAAHDYRYARSAERESLLLDRIGEMARPEGRAAGADNAVKAGTPKPSKRADGKDHPRPPTSA